MSTPTMKVSRELIRTACCAPSIHNTQPWSWRLPSADTIELYADRSRQLKQIDPDGRDLVISCGAALHHLTVAAEGFGLSAETRTPPPGSDGDLLARVHLGPGATTPQSVELLSALENRMTDRRGFTDWEVPGPRLRRLAELATAWGVHVLPVTDPGLSSQVRSLVEQARDVQAANPLGTEEQDAWIDHAADDGVPVRSAMPRPLEGVPRNRDRFSPGDHEHTRARPGAIDHAGDVLMVIYTAYDNQESWLAAGQSLSALWIRATQDGMSLTPESQVIEVDQTRTLLRRTLLDDLGHPQVLVHVGWQDFSRSQLDRTPRRALEDVLLP